MGETTEDLLGDQDPDHDPGTMRSPTETQPAPADILLVDLFERFVVAQERQAEEARRRNDIQQKFYELAADNSKHANRLVKGVARAVERDAAACPTCAEIGKCKEWCHTKKYP